MQEREKPSVCLKCNEVHEVGRPCPEDVGKLDEEIHLRKGIKLPPKDENKWDY